MPWYGYVILLAIALLTGGGLFWAWKKGLIKSNAALGLFFQVLQKVMEAERMEEFKGSGRGADKKAYVLSLLAHVLDQKIIGSMIDTIVSVLNSVGWGDDSMLRKFFAWLKGMVSA